MRCFIVLKHTGAAFHCASPKAADTREWMSWAMTGKSQNDSLKARKNNSQEVRSDHLEVICAGDSLCAFRQKLRVWLTIRNGFERGAGDSCGTFGRNLSQRLIQAVGRHGERMFRRSDVKRGGSWWGSALCDAGRHKEWSGKENGFRGRVVSAPARPLACQQIISLYRQRGPSTAREPKQEVSSLPLLVMSSLKATKKLNKTHKQQ